MRAHAVRFVAFDLDGTVLNRDGQPVDGVLGAIESLPAKGLTPVLVSGRSLESFRRLDCASELLGVFEDEFLLNDGNVIVNGRTGEATFARTLDPHVLEHLVKAGLRELVVEVDGVLSTADRAAGTKYSMAFGVPRSTVRVESVLPEGRPTSIVIFDPEPGVPAALHGHEFDAHTLRSFAATVVRPSGTCKASALAAHLARRYDGAGLTEVVAVGDGYNDGCMLGSAALGIAVAASDAVAVRHCDIHLNTKLDRFLDGLDQYSIGDLLAGAKPSAARGCFGGHERPSEVGAA